MHEPMPRHERRRVRFSDHALSRLEEREISRVEAERIVRSGARQPQGLDAWLWFGSISGTRLAVACTLKGNVILVKTVHFEGGWLR